MYACSYETGCGFFEGVCAPGNATAHLRDPPPPPSHSRIALCQHAVSGDSRHSGYSFTAPMSCGSP